jgi:hypothetical protein
LDSSPAPAAGSKRVVALGGSTPPSKRFRCAWKPLYAKQLCSHLFLFHLFVVYLIGFFVDQHAYHWCDRVRSRGSSQSRQTPDAPEGTSPQGSLTMAAGGDEVPAPDTTTAAEAMASPMTCDAAASDRAASTGPTSGAPFSPPRMAAATALTAADDNAVEEPEVIMGHPGLMVPGTVSLSEAMGMTHFALNQAHDVLRQEREDINEERLHLSVWVSLLKSGRPLTRRRRR